MYKYPSCIPLFSFANPFKILRAIGLASRDPDPLIHGAHDDDEEVQAVPNVVLGWLGIKYGNRHGKSPTNSGDNHV